MAVNLDFCPITAGDGVIRQLTRHGQTSPRGGARGHDATQGRLHTERGNHNRIRRQLGIGHGQYSSSQHAHSRFGGGGGGPITTTGPWMTGKGGVFLSLCSIRSSARATPFPSNFTSNEKFTNSAFPFVLLDTTPPAAPASSPTLVLKFESSTHTGLPSHFTFLVPF